MPRKRVLILSMICVVRKMNVNSLSAESCDAHYFFRRRKINGNFYHKVGTGLGVACGMFGYRIVSSLNSFVFENIL